MVHSRLLLRVVDNCIIFTNKLCIILQNNHLSEGIRIFLIASDKCSVDISDVEVYFSILIHKEPHLSDTIRKIWILLDKWDSHSKGT